ncbi:fimbrial protein [Dyella acidiphila]|uniref:Type 1 fimbrial protein n=1 Tax=Dyella acidiphila TaxID=2775866 RepID=A0ABR9G8Y8_9GAMM|nr:fimbrial protein [Dyella acidiphila]MBE1160518.1 type 1 fimbrial protein [Dyella acidiphila]
MNSFAKTSRVMRSAFVALIWLIVAPCSFAACSAKTAAITLPPVTYSGSADSLKPGTPLNGAWSAQAGAKYFFDIADCKAASVAATPAKPAIPGLSYSDGTNVYSVYPSGVDGIGYVVSVAEQDYNGWFPLTSPRTFMYQGTSDYWTWMGTYAKVMLVVTGQLKTGTYTIPGQTIITSNVYNVAGTALVTPPGSITLNSASITIAASTCKMTTPNNQSVNLPTVGQAALAAAASGAGGGAGFHIGMNCDAAVKLYVTMTDASNPSSVADTLSLAPGSTAKGVGVQVSGSTPVSYGPDSSIKGNTNQWQIGESATAMTYDIPFTAAYVRTGAVTPGSVQAKATFTFSYQ